jgi:glucose dehydrogenase
MRNLLIGAFLLALTQAAVAAVASAADAGWPAYGGDAGGTRYSALALPQ